MKMFAMLTIAKATPARLIGWRSSIRSLCRGSTSGGGVLSVSMLDLGLLCLFRFPVRICSVERNLLQRCVVQAVLLAVMVHGHFAIPPRPVHGIDIRIQKYLIEVPHNNRQCRQDRFVEVNRSGHIEPPARQMVSYRHLCPKHDSCSGHDEHAPHQSPVLCLLRVIETRELGLPFRDPQVVAEILPCPANIVECRKEVEEQAPTFAGKDRVESVVNADADQNDCRHAMQELAHSLA